ncbi:CPCC family cysteine-rich protein [Chitinophaga horti]|uniref:CPCC family cysteine-rich protein n=1 Tax=Chitinophaga horti TaxID=2920382 RepID=A0ABY6IVZ6_9BACT|nr:CPCC family cysteine-rich protein [Chitinophaga horti]UYQ91548.1 CPCC family cysteine-rich protein [Chitinophaga horti]
MKTRIPREDAEELLARQRLAQLSAAERKAIATTIGLADESNITEELDAVHYLRSQLLAVTNEYIEQKLSQHQQQPIEIDGAPLLYEPCCCCGYRTISRREQLEICPVCFWEDDGSCEPERFSEENAMTLDEGMRNFKEWGVFDLKYKVNVTEEPEQYLRK